MGEQLPRFSDGDYRDWPQSEINRVLPREIRDQFGEFKTTFLTGSCEHIEPRHQEEIKRRVEPAGHVVEDGTSLSIYSPRDVSLDGRCTRSGPNPN